MQKSLMFAALFCAFFPLASLPVFAEDGLALKAEIPYREDAGLSKAEYYIAKEKYSEAIAETAAVLKRHPRSADAYTYMGFAYDRLGDAKKAAEYFRRALLISPAHLGANKYLADIYLSEGNLALAMEQMQVIRLTCGNADCPELNALQSGINSFRKSGKAKPSGE